MNVALNHNAHDALLAPSNLLGQHRSNLGLVPMVLFTIPVATVHHQPGTQSLCCKLLLGLSY